MTDLGSQAEALKQLAQAEIKTTKPELKGGLTYVKEQVKGFFSSQDKRTRAFREQVQGAERKIQDSTYTTYARVLTEEYLALDKVVKKKSDLPLLPWQQQLIDVVQHHFDKHHDDENYSLVGKSKQEEYDAYYAVFDGVLKSKDPDKAKQWLATSMIVAERQLMALQMGTGAHARVTREADHIDHVEEPEAMAATIATELGVPIDKVLGDVGKYRKFVARLQGDTGLVEVTGNFLGWLYKQDPGRRIKWEQETKMLEMMDRFQEQSRKRVYSEVEVDFRHNALFALDRKYKPRVNQEVELDPVQKEYLLSQKRLATVHPGDRLDAQAQKEVRILMKRLVHARQEAFYVEFDKQLRTSNQLNLLTPSQRDQNLYEYSVSGLGSVKPEIEGMVAMTVGLDSSINLNQQLNEALDAMQKEVNRERLDYVAAGDMYDNVSEQIDSLTASLKKKELTPDQQRERKLKEGEKKKYEEQKTDLEKYLEHEDEILTLDEQIERQKSEAKLYEDAKNAAKKAENEEKAKTRAKVLLEAEKTDREEDLESYKAKIQEADTAIAQASQQLGERRARHQGETKRLGEINSAIIDLDNWITTHPITQQNQSQVNQAEHATKMSELTELKSQRDKLSMSIASFAADESRLKQEISDNESKVNNPQTGYYKKIEEAREAIYGAGGLDEQIDEAQAVINSKAKEREKQQKIVDNGKEVFDNIAELEQKKKDLQAKKEATLEAIQRKDSSLTSVDSVRARLKNIQEDIDRVDSDISAIDSDLDTERMSEQHQMDVLTCFKDEFLQSAKWSGIKSRARTPLTAQAEAALLDKEDTFAHLALGAKNRPFVMPAYIRLMTILGGEESVKRTKSGQELYARLTKVVTPEQFFNIFKSDPARSAALAQALGLQNLPSDLSVYDERLRNNPDVRRLMVRMVDRHFTEELLGDLVKQANRRTGSPETGDSMSEASTVGMLGKLDQVTLDRMRDIAIREKRIPKDEIKKRIEGYDAKSREFRFTHDWASFARRAESIGQVNTYVLGTLKLNNQDTPKIIDIVRTLTIQHNLNVDTTVIYYTPHLAEARAMFANARINLSDQQIVDTINAIRPLSLTKEDINALAAKTEFQTACNKITALSAQDAPLVALSIRSILHKYSPSGELSDSATYDQSFEGKKLSALLQEEIQRRMGNKRSLGALSDGEIRDLVVAHDACQQIVQRNSEAIAQTAHEFLRYGGEEHDSVFLISLMNEIDSTTAEELQKAMYQVAGRGKPTLDVIMSKLSDPKLAIYLRSKRAFIQNQITQNRQLQLNEYTNIPIGEFQKDMIAVIANLRSKGLGAQVSAQIRMDEIEANRKQEGVELQKARLARRIDRLGKKYWGESGRSLVLSIERELSGRASRDEAIRLARAIEENRKKASGGEEVEDDEEAE